MYLQFREINLITLLSATVSPIAAVNLKHIVKTTNFIIGIATIPIIIITPIKPTVFLSIFEQPITVSTVSPKTFPTTGIKFATATLAVFDVSPSTELLSVPSNDSKHVKIVKATPKTHTIDDFKYLAIEAI